MYSSPGDRKTDANRKNITLSTEACRAQPCEHCGFFLFKTNCHLIQGFQLPRPQVSMAMAPSPLLSRCCAGRPATACPTGGSGGQSHGPPLLLALPTPRTGTDIFLPTPASTRLLPRPSGIGALLGGRLCPGFAEGVDGRVTSREVAPSSSWELWLCWVT